MSDLVTRTMMAAYFQEAAPTPYFAGMFKSPASNFHSTEEVEVDIMRTGEDVAIVVTDLATGYRMNSADLFTNKSFKPPVFKEAIALNSSDLLKRMPGSNPFADVGFRAAVITRMMRGMRTVENKVKRSMELQASQVMQTGVVTLANDAGTTLYSLDYAPKATHFPTAGTSWASATLAQKIADLTSLAAVIRADGLTDVDEITMGSTVWENLIQTTGFSTRFDMRNANLGSITSSERRGKGETYRGTIELGSYKLDVFTYSGRYKHPQTGVSTEFMTPGKVLMRASSARLDAAFGAVPNIGQLLGASSRIIPEMPSRMSSASNGMDMFTNIWLSADGEQLFGGIAARPLMVPTAIDTYGCLTTQL